MFTLHSGQLAEPPWFPAIIMAECLFNTAVPVTIRSSGVPFGTYAMPPPPPAAMPFQFYSTSAPINFHDASGRRMTSVLFEINLIPIIANKKVTQKLLPKEISHL